MRLPPRPVRRWVLDPLWPLLAVVLVAGLLVVAAAGAVTWPATRRARVARLALLAALYLALNTGLLVACAALWLAHPRPGRRDEDRWLDAHAALLRWALGRLRRASGPLLGFRVDLEEPPLPGRLDAGPLLLLARHAGPGDSFTLVEMLLTRYRRRPRIVLKEILQWDPGLDVILNRLGACFLPPHPATGPDGASEALADRLADLARDLHGSDAMLLFPEGGNWTPGRYQKALARLRRRSHRQAAADAEQNPNVLPPRPAGVLACLAARPGLGIVVIAHTGLEDLISPATVWRALPLRDRPMTVRWWYVPPGSIPAGPDRQYQWLRLQWALVDSWIGARKAQAGQEEPARPPESGLAGPALPLTALPLTDLPAADLSAADPAEAPGPLGSDAQEPDPLLDTPG